MPGGLLTNHLGPWPFTLRLRLTGQPPVIWSIVGHCSRGQESRASCTLALKASAWRLWVPHPLSSTGQSKSRDRLYPYGLDESRPILCPELEIPDGQRNDHSVPHTLPGPGSLLALGTDVNPTQWSLDLSRPTRWPRVTFGRLKRGEVQRPPVTEKIENASFPVFNLDYMLIPGIYRAN